MSIRVTNPEKLPEIPALIPGVNKEIVNGQELVNGYNWVYPDGKIALVEKFERNYPLIKLKTGYHFFTPRVGYPGVPSPIHSRNDILPGRYREIIPSTRQNSSIFLFDVDYVRGTTDNKYVYKNGVEFEYWLYEDELTLSNISVFNKGVLINAISFGQFYANDRYYNELLTVIEYQGRFISSMDYLDTIRLFPLMDYRHIEFDGTSLNGLFFRYQVPIEIANKPVIKIVDEKVVFPLPRDNIIEYFHVDHDHLKGPFKIGDIQGTFKTLPIKEFSDAAEYLTRKDLEKYVEGFLKIGDQEFYISQEAGVEPYQTWLTETGKEVSKSLDLEGLPGIGKIITDYQALSPEDIQSKQLPKGAYQGLMKKNLEQVAPKQDPVIKTILEYL